MSCFSNMILDKNLTRIYFEAKHVAIWVPLKWIYPMNFPYISVTLMKNLFEPSPHF